MIEAVGWEYFDVFFRRCSELLRPHGLFLLQAIGVDDRAYAAEKSSRTFATELIFPGGCLPSLEVIQRCVVRNTDMRTVWLDDISASYALTLRHWRERFWPPRPSSSASATTSASAALGDVSGDLRGRLPRGADRRPPDPVREARMARRARAVRRRRRPSGSGRRRSDPVARQRLLPRLGVIDDRPR